MAGLEEIVPRGHAVAVAHLCVPHLVAQGCARRGVAVLNDCRLAGKELCVSFVL